METVLDIDKMHRSLFSSLKFIALQEATILAISFQFYCD